MGVHFNEKRKIKDEFFQMLEISCLKNKNIFLSLLNKQFLIWGNIFLDTLSYLSI